MRYASHVVAVSRGWADALRGWRDNPLVQYWGREQHRGVLPWLGLAFAALLCLALGALLVEAAGAGGFSAHLQRREIAMTATGLLGFTAAGWLAGVLLPVRLFQLLTFALGFLDRDTRRGRYAAVDDLLAVSALSEQELLVGQVVQALRTAWPAVFLGTVVAGVVLLHLTADHYGIHYGIVVWHWWQLATVPAALLFTAATCGVSVALWTLLAAALGGGRGIASLFGAAGILAGQLFIIAMAGSLPGLYMAEDEITGPLAGVCAAIVVTLLVGLLLYLSRRLSWLRFALTAGLPMTLIGILVVTTLTYSEPVMYDAVWALNLAALTGLQHLAPLSWALAGDPGGVRVLGGYIEPWRVFALLPLQLPLLAAAAEFARDALRRRRWESDGREG